MYFLWFIFFIFIVYHFESNGMKESSLQVNKRNSLVSLGIFFIIFFSLLSLQYGVGTDYFSYVSLFKGNYIDLYKRNTEFLFYYLCCFLSKYKIHPQMGFVFLSFIQFFCINKFLKFMNLKSNTIFFYLYFTVATFMFNQTNGIRQYTAAAILLLFVKYSYEKKIIKMILSIFIASMFHSSAIMFIPVFFVVKLLSIRLNNFIWIIYLLISIILIRVNIVSKIINLIPFLSRYSHYLDSLWGGSQFSFVNIFTKILYIPFYFFSLKSLKKLSDKKNVLLFQLGFFSYGIKLICLSSPILNRFAGYFEFFTIMPLYYFIFDFFDKKIRIKYFNLLFIFLFGCITVGMFFLKTVLMATGEYEYKSILQAIFEGQYNI